jgi:hypothetical protein
VTLPDGGRYQDFACATIYWSRDTGAHAVQDAILRRYRELGGPTGTLGYPLTDQIPTKNASRIQEVVLLRRGSVTHSFNSDQRYVELMIVDRRPGAVTAVVPHDGALLPPGPYFVFVVDRERVPSVGRCVLLCWRDPACRPVGIKRREIPRRPVVSVIDKPREIDLTSFEALSKRVSALEQEVTRLTAFVETQQRPLFMAHGLAAHPPTLPGEAHGTGPHADGEGGLHGGGDGGAGHEPHRS